MIAPSHPIEDPRRSFAEDVVRRLRDRGFEALFAGGCVRDLILGREASDFDVATNARPEAVIDLFPRTVPVGVSFGVVRVIGSKGRGEVEVATFRSDGAYSDGRRPETVTFGSAEADAARRDFTINGMFLDPISNEVIDFVGGRADLDRGLLRAIGDPEARFAEDKLRLLRAVRFAARFGLEIEPSTRTAIARMAPQVRQVSAERIADELRKILASPTRRDGIALASDAGLIAAIFPVLVDLPADLRQHTLRTLGHLPDFASFPLAMAALLLHVGEPQAESACTAEIGGRITDAIARDLKLANADRERSSWLVASRKALVDPGNLRESALKRWLALPGIDELLALHRADAMASNGPVGHVDFCEHYRRDQPQGPIDPAPLLTGQDLIQNGWKAGPRFKEILTAAYDEQLERRIKDKAEALAWLASVKERDFSQNG